MIGTTQPDVIVIGGGPSGSTTATLLAQKGLRVHLYEREHFPRFHIGESLIPMTYHVFKRLGLLEKLKDSHFTKKYSVQFIGRGGRLSAPFFFNEYRPEEASQTWQVRRSEFDLMLLDNARDHGVEVFEGHRVIEALLDGDKCRGIRVQDEATGQEKTVEAKVVVDASGQSSVIMDRLNLREWDPVLKKAAIWTYFKGALRGEGLNAGATLVLQTQDKKGWFWYIPLHDDVMSVGVVAGFDYLFKNRDTKDVEAIYWQEVERCPGLKRRLATATQCDVFRAAKEYSYRAKRIAGDGWVLVGDAFGFLDPLYSSGVLLAVTSGRYAADAIGEAFAKNDFSRAQLGNWEEEYVAGMERMRRLVVAYYEGVSFGKFIDKYPECKSDITDLLMGDLFRPELEKTLELIEATKAEMSQDAHEAVIDELVTT